MHKLKQTQHLGTWKGVHIFWVAKEVIKQMKRLQNLGMVNGDDRNDMGDMEDMEHQGENEDHVIGSHEIQAENSP